MVALFKLWLALQFIKVIIGVAFIFAVAALILLVILGRWLFLYIKKSLIRYKRE